MSFFVYIVKCCDKTFYTGSTRNVQKRLHEHNNTKAGAKYTQGRRPVRLVYQKKCKSLAQARALEAKIKRLSREEKMDFIKSYRAG